MPKHPAETEESLYDEWRLHLWKGLTSGSNSARFSDGWELTDIQVEEGLVFLFRKGTRILVLEALPVPGRSQTDALEISRMNSHGSAGSSPDEEINLTVSLRDRLRALMPSPAHPASTRMSRKSTRIRLISVSRALSRSGTPGIEYGLNPYVGCLLGCSFCYAQTRVAYARSFAGYPTLPWGSYVDVKINLPDVLRQELKTLRPNRIGMSPIITDPYQDVEKRYRVTRGCLNVMAQEGCSVSILTREPRVLEDLETLRLIPGAQVGLSIPTDDDSMRKLFEPRTPPIPQRLAALKQLRDAGIRTFVFIQPILPMLDPRALAESLFDLVDAAEVRGMTDPGRVETLSQSRGLEDYFSPERQGEVRAVLENEFRRHGIPPFE